jgi:hypothetical protein
LEKPLKSRYFVIKFNSKALESNYIKLIHKQCKVKSTSWELTSLEPSIKILLFFLKIISNLKFWPIYYDLAKADMTQMTVHQSKTL